MATIGPTRISATGMPPAHSFRAHNAPLGMTFIRHSSAPDGLRGAALVALHGSWNRSRLDGYKVVSLHWDEGGNITERDFLTGFEVDEDVIGRPVDVAEGPDGAIYVSDDYADVIYRVRLAENAGDAATGGPALPASAPKFEGDPLAALAPDVRSEQTARGRTLFDEQACGSCHRAGQATEGVVVKRLEGLSERYDIETLTRFFLTPTPPMPVVALGEADRRALAIYLLEQHP